MAIKVKMVEIDGKKRVPPEIMDLLLRLGQHKEYCERCTKAVDMASGDYCHIGTDLILKLEADPNVQFIPEPGTNKW